MQFGYSYPELQPWKYKTTEDYLLSINTDIAKLYRATADHISDSYEIGTDKDIVHYDHVINIRYGKCVIPPSLTLGKLTFVPKIRPWWLAVHNQTLPTPARLGSWRREYYAPNPEPSTSDPDLHTLNPSRPSSASIVGWDCLHRQRLQFLDCNRSSRHEHSLRQLRRPTSQGNTLNCPDSDHLISSQDRRGTFVGPRYYDPGGRRWGR